MRILVLAPHSYYIDRGSPIDVDLLVRALSARGEQVDLAVYPDGADRQYPRVTLHRPRTPQWLRRIGPGPSLRKLLADWYLFRLASRLVKQGRFDVIHAGEESVFMAMWFKHRHGIPYVYDMDSSIAQQVVERRPWLWLLRPIFSWFEARAIRGSLAVAPVCNALADLARRRGGRNTVTLHDISQLADPGREPTGALRQRLKLDGAPILLYVGNLEPYQGIDLLLKGFAAAIQQGATTHLVVAGGDHRGQSLYESKARRLGIEQRTHFIGPWPAARLDELLAEADILTAPRIRGINTPMKIFPYLHSGKPVLVTDLPTHSQILDSTVAVLAPANPEGFGAAILRLDQDPELRARLGASGQAFVERNHTFAAHQRRVDELYDRVLQTIALTPRSPDA